jgi:mediator of RNA polymerase II transcription subunit 21
MDIISQLQEQLNEMAMVAVNTFGTLQRDAPPVRLSNSYPDPLNPNPNPEDPASQPQAPPVPGAPPVAPPPPPPLQAPPQPALDLAEQPKAMSHALVLAAKKVRIRSPLAVFPFIFCSPSAAGIPTIFYRNRRNADMPSLHS